MTDRRIRWAVLALTLTATALIIGGFLARAVWLIGIGAWLVIAAFLLEMIYRPGRYPGER
ncbi:hypothetical protein ACTMTU_32105 [Streptomyces sp. OZ13]|uniref:hypothetical protein n=1 Tax=Streptomyces sp. OZ13 TaxID=3452210 RepID=UPI003F8ADDF9